MPLRAEAAEPLGKLRHGLQSTARSARPSAFARTAARGRLDRLLFLAATAIVALHAAVDSFIAPEPGTGPGDHLLRGSASLALLARQPSAIRACARRAGRPRGDPGRARSRRSEPRDRGRARGRRPRRGLDRVPPPPGRTGIARERGRSLVAHAQAGAAPVPAASWHRNWRPWSASTGSSFRSRSESSPRTGRVLMSPQPTSAGHTRRWRFGRAMASTSPPGTSPRETAPPSSPTRLDRGSWRRRGCSSATATACSCSTRAATTAARAIRTRSAGRARRTSTPPSPGCSDGRTWSDGHIGGIGFSVGGEMMLQAAASNTGLRAVVAEGAGVRSVREHMLRGARGWFSLPEAAVETAAVGVLSGTAPPPSLTDLVSRIAPRPLFLIYAGQGGGGEELNPDYYDAASMPKALWKIPEAGHVGGYPGPPTRVRRARDELLRPSATRAEMTGPLASPAVPGIELHWLPLGAGGHSVRLNLLMEGVV